MSLSFDVFMKKCLEQTYSDDREVVDGVFHDLGFWCIDELSELMKEKDIDFLSGNSIYEIAVGCCGKDYVKRKLEEKRGVSHRG